MHVTVEEAKTILPELCELARSGLTVVITKDGEPYTRLVACEGSNSPENKKIPDRAELRDSLPPGAFKLLPGWDEPLASLLESENNKGD